MSNQLLDLLAQWYPERNQCDWILGTIYKTKGTCYRKSGAMMLFNSHGRQLGMLSGGCLESDIQVHARKVMHHGRSLTLCYDASDEDDLSFQLGIGCGGTVYIMLHPIHRDNHYLQLEQIFRRLKQRQHGLYQLRIPDGEAAPDARFTSLERPHPTQQTAFLQRAQGYEWLLLPIKPAPHLLVIGGGIDARPVVTLAKSLGWEVSVWDSRPANARAEFFQTADTLLRTPIEELAEYMRVHRVNAVIMMTHNVKLDAAALMQVNQHSLDYVALLGPTHRRHKVLEQAKLNEFNLKQPVSGPAGLDIGGELPESIALSILAECHQALHKA